MTLDLSVNIDVDDLDRAIAFYTAALGFELCRRLSGDVAELAGAGIPVFLLQKAAGTAAWADGDLRRDYRRHWTPVHLDVVVQDIGTALSRALAAGARQEGGIASHEWGRIATLSDPFGNGFCLVELGAEGYDAAAC